MISNLTNENQVQDKLQESNMRANTMVMNKMKNMRFLIEISILIIVTALMILHYILEEFNLMKGLSSVFSPLMRLFGLPQDAAFLWLVGNVVGLAYGGAIMVEQMEQRKLSYGDGNLLNHHLAVCHSLLEDTIIFAAIGVPVLWVVPTRLFFAIAVVWILRGYSYMYARKVKHIYE